MGGDYYRLLVDGSYAVQVKSPGYEIQTQYVNVENKPNQNNAQRLDFILQPIPNERIQFRRMLRKYLNKVKNFLLLYF